MTLGASCVQSACLSDGVNASLLGWSGASPSPQGAQAEVSFSPTEAEDREEEKEAPTGREKRPSRAGRRVRAAGRRLQGFCLSL